MRDTADVSIVTANFNCSKFLSEYMNSIFSSSMLPKEIIFIDDNSTDNSLEKIQTFGKHDLIRVIRQKENIGFANSLNVGTKNAIGKYIMRLDPDDFICEERIEKQFNYLSSNSSVDLVGSNVHYFHHDLGKVIGQSNVPLNTKEILDSYKRGSHGIFHTSVMGKRKLFEDLLYNQKCYPAEDYEFFSRILKKGFSLVNINEPLTFYRIHQNNHSFVHHNDSIIKTFEIRQKQFGLKKNTFRLKIVQMQQRSYRKYLLSTNHIAKTWYIMLAGVFNFRSVVRRIRKSNLCLSAF